MDAVAVDPHHDGASEWGVLRKELFTRVRGLKPRPWVKVKRVSVTYKRIFLINALMTKRKNRNYTPTFMKIDVNLNYLKPTED